MAILANTIIMVNMQRPPGDRPFQLPRRIGCRHQNRLFGHVPVFKPNYAILAQYPCPISFWDPLAEVVVIVPKQKALTFSSWMALASGIVDVEKLKCR
jgi:hypothetical protein